MSGQAPKYTDTEITEALAQLALNGDNLTKTSRESGIPRSTLRKYRDEQRALMDGVALATTDPIRAREPAELWHDAQALATAEMTAKLKAGDNRLHDLAYASKISSDAYLDHTAGRRGGVEVNVDARSVHLPALEALSDADLQALIDREAARTAAEAEE